MGTGTLGQIVEQKVRRKHPNDTRDATYQDWVPRNTSGVATTEAGGIGTDALRWADSFIKSITLGDALSVLKIFENGANNLVFDTAAVSTSISDRINSVEVYNRSASSHTFKVSGVTKWFVDTNGGDGANLKALSVAEAAIAALAVTTTKIASLAVTAAKIGALAVTTTKIDSLAVTTAKIGAAAVTRDKLSPVSGDVTAASFGTTSATFVEVTGTSQVVAPVTDAFISYTGQTGTGGFIEVLGVDRAEIQIQRGGTAIATFAVQGGAAGTTVTQFPLSLNFQDSNGGSDTYRVVVRRVSGSNTVTIGASRFRVSDLR